MQSFRLTAAHSTGRIAASASLVAAALAGAYLFGDMRRGDATTEGSSTPAAAAPHFNMRQKTTQWRAPLLVGVEVRDLDGNRVGVVEDLLMTHDGMVQTVVIGVGGFFGLGTKQVAVPFAAIQWGMNAHPASLVVDAGARAADRAAADPSAAGARGCATSVEAAQGRPDRAGLTATLAQLQAAPAFAYASRRTGGRDGEEAWGDSIASPYR